MNTQEPWSPRPADKVVRHPRMERTLPVRIELPAERVARRLRSRLARPSLVLIWTFGLLIGVGTALLSMPFSHHGDSLLLVDALFTATSAATVTGLVTVETATYWTRQGQVVILALMFVGGLGIMTIATALFVIAGQRISLTQRLVMRETIGTKRIREDNEHHRQDSDMGRGHPGSGLCGAAGQVHDGLPAGGGGLAFGLPGGLGVQQRRLHVHTRQRQPCRRSGRTPQSSGP